MKQPLLKTALLTLAGTALVASSSMAQSSTTYAQGDFLLGFRATGGTGAGSNVLVDIGGSGFLSSPNPTVFTLPNLFGSLNGTFGNGWTSRSDVFFSVSAADAASSSTIYITAPETGGVEATPWNGLGTSLQTGVRNKINSAGGLVPANGGYNAYLLNVNPNGSGPAVIEGQNDTNSYGSFMPGGTVTNSGPAPGISWAQFNPTTEGTFALGTGGIKLDLIKLTNATGAGNPGLDLGDFTISNSGILTFTPDALEAVPEPSTYATVVLGAAILLLVRIRRRDQTAKI